MMIITPYHKGREKSLLHETLVLFNLVTFALSSIQWSASTTQGRIIGFWSTATHLWKFGKMVTSDIGFNTVIYQFLMDSCPLSQNLHLTFQSACQARVQRDPSVRCPGCFEQDYFYETKISCKNYIL